MKTPFNLFRPLCLALAAVVHQAAGQPAAAPSLTNVVPSAGGWLLSWEGTTNGAAYTVQYKEALADGIWRMPATRTPFPVSSNQWYDPVATNAGRFYRLAGVTPAARGRLLAVTYATTLPVSTLAFLFSYAGISITPEYGVALYKIDYETITPWGDQTLASGAIALPVGTPGAVPLVSYQHGTIALTNDPPSSMDINGEIMVGIAFASAGYAAVLADYLGMGDSPGFHPYHHAISEATACVDMLRAARTFCATNDTALNGRLFLCGYSQGGHSTMALLRELEAYHTNEFQVTACAAMAGAYDLSGTTANDLLNNVPNPNPYYFPYLLAAYQSVYHLGASFSNLLAAPYSATLPPLFNGNNDSPALNAALPATNFVQILDPAYLAALVANPRHPLRLALQENDVYRWTPVTPLRLYQCSGDQDVDPANAAVALAWFQTHGAPQVQFFDPLPGASHVNCAEPSLFAAKLWFDSFP